MRSFSFSVALFSFLTKARFPNTIARIAIQPPWIRRRLQHLLFLLVSRSACRWVAKCHPLLQLLSEPRQVDYHGEKWCHIPPPIAPILYLQ